MTRETKGEKAFHIITNIVCIVLMLVMVYPILHVLFASLSDSNKLMTNGGFLFYPQGFTLAAYEEVFQNRLIWSGYLNTIINLVFALLLNISLTTLGAYALSRREMMLRRPIMLMITFTMFFSGGMIPNYILIRHLGMVDTRWALFVPAAISAYNLIIMRTSFESIPETLFEAAKLDGAGEFDTLFRVAIPVSKAIIAVMILFYAVEQWNSWFPAFIYLKDRGLWPLQLVLREIVISNNLSDMLTGIDSAELVSVSESIKYATIVVATFPILCIYPFLQKYFVKGVMIGAVKG